MTARLPLIALTGGLLGLMAASFAPGQEPDDSHRPPDAPQYPMNDMPYKQMSALMQMDDTAPTAKLLFDQLEWRNTGDGNAAAWDTEAWFGGDYNKIWLRSEGERVAGTTRSARADLLWDHSFARWWSVQAGGRQDFRCRPRPAAGQPSVFKDWLPTGSTLRRRCMSVSKGTRR